MGFTNNTRRVDGLACYPTEWAKKNSESQLCIILPLNKILRIENRTDLWTQGLKVHIQPWSWSWSPGATGLGLQVRCSSIQRFCMLKPTISIYRYHFLAPHIFGGIINSKEFRSLLVKFLGRDFTPPPGFQVSRPRQPAATLRVKEKSEDPGNSNLFGFGFHSQSLATWNLEDCDSQILRYISLGKL